MRRGEEGQDSSGPTMAKGKGGMGKQPAIGGKPRQVHEAQVAIGAAPTKAHSKGKQQAIGGKKRDEPPVGMSDTTWKKQRKP